jgi:hypothetical protein
MIPKIALFLCGVHSVVIGEISSAIVMLKLLAIAAVLEHFRNKIDRIRDES